VSEVASSPPDQAARDRICTELGSTLFVDAGAGSGKTTALVSRVVALVTSGEVELAAIAAITFTEKAAAELRDRIRVALEQAGAADDAGEEVRARCRAAVEQVDGAAIGTLHAFARRLLAAHAIEARLPPRIEVLDEVSSGVAFENRWRATRDQLLSDPGLAPSLRLLLALGVQVDDLRHLSARFDDNWDLVATIPDVADPVPAVGPQLRAAIDAVRGVCDEVVHCKDAADLLAAKLSKVRQWTEGLTDITDEVELLELTGDTPSWGCQGGKRANWVVDVKATKESLRDAGDNLGEARQQIGEAALKHIAAALRTATIDAAEDRRRAGQLEFHDLLVMARSLLVDPEHGPAVRARLQGTYQRILLDEFQDTDPIQIELAVRIAAADPASPAAAAPDWRHVTVEPGRLFVVGDPKQSIYRFRRADIRLWLQAEQCYAPAAGGAVHLTTNFRTGPHIIDWVNRTFERLFADAPATDVDGSQAPYVPLTAERSEPPTGPSVSVLGRWAHPGGDNAEALRAAEAADVAAAIAGIIADGWSVADGDGWRPARLGDITILVPARTSLPYLEDALEGAGIGFRAEASSLVYATRAVRNLLMVLRAADDPTNHLHVVSALRTPLLGCSDVELYHHKVTNGRGWNYLAPRPNPPDGDDRVSQGLAYLRALHDQRPWRAPSELLDAIARDRRSFELGMADRRPRDTWRRLRWVIDQARAWSDAVGGTLREYLAWVDQHNADGPRITEPVLPEADDDAVRIMTIHAAKGLEFSITILSGMSTAPRGRRAKADVVFLPEGVGYHFGAKLTTRVWEAWKPIDEQMAADERIRLLYVAATRAKDHLVVSLHRKERKDPPTQINRTNAEQLVAGMGDLLVNLPNAPHGDAPLADGQRLAVTPPAPFDEWRAELDAALAAASRPLAVAATAMDEHGRPDGDDPPPGTDADPGLQKRQRDLDQPPWLKGRYGSAVGRAVHGVLQVVDLATGEGLEALVAAQCEAEAVPNRAAQVADLVRAALASDVVQEAARSPHWRELYVATPLDEHTLLEGYIDLLYRSPAGLVVVDYKTSATADPAQLDARLAGYRGQGQAYRRAVAAVTGEPVTVVTFLFLTRQGAIARTLQPTP
jgi:ATP-dependent helicase/nuclease subunit A